MAGFGNNYVSEDTIFVSGLPQDTTEEQLAQYFGQIGIIKFDKKNDCPKIWIYKDKSTGKGKGEATVTYDDPPTATSAISWFNGKEFRGSTLTIELAQRKSAPPQFNRGGGSGGRGGRGGHFDRSGGGGGGGGNYHDRQRDDRGGSNSGRGGSSRPGDWLCPSCNNNNFASRHECNRCRTQRPASNYRNQDFRGNSDRGGRDRNYRDHRGSSGGGGGNYRSSGPSRNHERGDRRSRPY